MPRFQPAFTCVAIFICVCMPKLGAQDATSTAETIFAEQIAPVLVSRCLVCHGGRTTEGGYSLATFELLSKPGDSSETPIVANHSDRSELLRRLTTEDADERMPAEGQPLSQSEITAIRQWIDEGATLPKADRTRSLSDLAALSTRPSQPPAHYPRPLPIHTLAITPDGATVLVGGYGEVTGWRAADGMLQTRWPVRGAFVADIELSSDATSLAISSGTPGQNGFVQVINCQQPDPSIELIASLPEVAADVAWSVDGRLAIAGADGGLRIAHIKNRTDAKQAGESTLQSFTPHADSILALGWSHNGRKLLTASRDRTAKLFETEKWDLIVSYDRHERSVGGVAFVDQRPITLDETGSLRLMPGDDSDRSVAERSGLPRFLQHLSWDAQQVAVLDKNRVQLFAVEQKSVNDGEDKDGQPKTKQVTRFVAQPELLAATTAWLTAVDLNERFIVAGSELGEVFVWDRGTRQVVNHFIAKP